MGSKDPDKIGPQVTFAYVLTLRDFQARGARIREYCPTCRVAIRREIETMIKLQGDHFIPWGARFSCRVDGCEGRAMFQVQGMSGQTWKPMTERVTDYYLRIVGKVAYDGATDTRIW